MNHNELTRFDLEEAIHVVWGTSQDIKLIWEQFYDGKQKMTEDEMANLLLGIQELHNLRSKRLWEIFETLVHEGKI